VELIRRMLDGSIPYDPEGRLELVSSGLGANQRDKIERLKDVPMFEACSQRQLRSVARLARVFDVAAGTLRRARGRRSSMQTTRGDATLRDALVICNSSFWNPSKRVPL